ncbi:hypothetical protein, variant [Verruconis gallopava]|nr:hypothetical protein, variant [Verruconis gallopava]KIV98909.1 hypothetical protein, variant [Verruconis gallopava]
MGRPRKRPREENDTTVTSADANAANGINFNDTSGELTYDFNSLTPELISGLPGTGMPLSMASSIPLDFFKPHQEASLSWLDPLLQNVGTDQPDQEFRAHIPDASVASNRSPEASSSSFTTSASTMVQFSSTPGTCLCLHNMYMTLSELAATKDWSFPYSVHKLKLSLQTANSVLKCLICPLEPTSAMQNLMTLSTVLTTITDCYRKILTSIDAEVKSAEEEGRSMMYRMGDSNPERWHLHTGTADCPMGVNIDLAPSEYKMLSRKVISTDVLGSARASAHRSSQLQQQNSDTISVLGLVQRLEHRQREWHKSAAAAELQVHYARSGMECRPEEGDYMCLKLVGTIRRRIETLGL